MTNYGPDVSQPNQFNYPGPINSDYPADEPPPTRGDYYGPPALSPQATHGNEVASRVRRRQLEAAIQRAIFQHLRIRSAPNVFVFHCPNGGYRQSRPRSSRACGGDNSVLNSFLNSFPV
jgi:hypothetical protein